MSSPSKPARRSAGKARRPASPRTRTAKAGGHRPAPKGHHPNKGTPRQRLERALDRLHKVFGDLMPPETGSVIEKAIFLVVREHGSEASSTRSMAALKENFIDWNEVRASRPSELARLMAGPGRMSTAMQKRMVECARRVRDLIDQVYGDRNSTSLEFLLEQSQREQLEYLQDIEDLGVHNAYALVQWLSADDKLVAVAPSLAKAAHRLGCLDSAAVTKARKELSALVDKDALVAVQAHLTQLGELDEAQWPPSLKELAG